MSNSNIYFFDKNQFNPYTRKYELVTDCYEFYSFEEAQQWAKNSGYGTPYQKEIKVEIRDRLTSQVIFSLELPKNTLKTTIEEAIKQKIDLSNANLEGANLEGADLANAWLTKAI